MMFCASRSVHLLELWQYLLTVYVSVVKKVIMRIIVVIATSLGTEEATSG